MKTIGTHNYYVYIVTNKLKTVLYIGLTNNLSRRLFEHNQDSIEEKKHFTGKYNLYFLLYYEYFADVNEAIRREKYLKGLLRKKKDSFITDFNPNWEFLNEQFTDII